MAEPGVNVATLIATLKLDISEFQKGIDGMNQRLSAMRASFEGAGQPVASMQTALEKAAGAATQMGLQTTFLGQAFAFLTKPLTLAGAALLSFGAALEHAKSSAVETATEVRQLMAVSGLSAVAADQLGDAFKALGFNSDTLAVMMFRMGTEIEAGGAGLGRLGVSLRTAGGEAKTEGQLFLEARDKIAALGSAADRNAALIDVFQRSARQVAPVFDLSREAFVQFLEKAEMLHPWSEQAQRDSIALKEGQAQLKLALDSLWSTIGVGLAGPAAKFQEWLTGVVVRLRDATKTVVDFVKSGAGLGGIAPGAAAPSPAPSVPGAATAAVAGSTRLTTAEFAALRAQATQAYQEQVQFYANVQALRQRDVADQLVTQTDALEAERVNVQARLGNATQYFNKLRDLATQETGGLAANNPAGIRALAEVEAARAQALAQLGNERIGIETKIAEALRQQFVVYNELQLAATRATPAMSIDVLARSLEEVNLRFDAAIQRAPAFIHELEALRATTVTNITAHDAFVKSLRGLEVQLGLDEAAAKDEQKLIASLGETFQKAADAALAFQRAQQVTERFGAIQRGAGIPTDMTAARLSATGSRIQELLGQQAEWNQELKNVDDTSDRFKKLTQWIEDSALEVGRLSDDLKGLAQIQGLKSFGDDIFGAFDRALTTSVTGVIQGTTTMSQAFHNFGQSVLISIEETLIKRAFKGLEQAFDAMLDSMDARAAISAALRAIGSLFGGLGGGTPTTSGPPDLGGVSPTAFQSGGVVTQPTLAMIGEHGPEAVIPLDRMPGAYPLGAGGGGLSLQIVVNTPSGTETSVQDTSTTDQRRIEISVVDIINRNLVTGRFDQTMRTIFGVTRQPVGR